MTIPPQKSDITVLIVDDSPVARELLRDILEECGYAVVGEAADGVEAVGKYRELRPLVTMMDVQMPRMDGIEAAREILTQDRDARILICSSSDRESLLSAAANAGACGCVAKPFILENIIDAIEAVI
jgi:two-component system chemotaxis response regulator CheY